MKLLLLLSLVVAVPLASGAFVEQKEPEVNEASQRATTTVLEVQQSQQEVANEKKLGKKSYDWGHGLWGWVAGHGYTHGWPIYSGWDHGYSGIGHDGYLWSINQKY